MTDLAPPSPTASEPERWGVAGQAWRCGAPECGGHQGMPPVAPERYWAVACSPVDVGVESAPEVVALPVDVVRRLFAYAQSADHAGLLDKCEDHLLADDAGCEVCTDLETVQLALTRTTSWQHVHDWLRDGSAGDTCSCGAVMPEAPF